MCLCLVANYTLDELEQVALDNFGEIVDKGAKIPSYVDMGDLYDNKTALGHFVKVIPNNDDYELRIIWPQLPSAKKYW